MRRWISSAVVYQVNLRSLAAREPRNAIEAAREAPDEGVSPLIYVTRHLATLKKLGANVIYMMPPYPVGMEGRKGIGSPYSIREFRDVDEECGTLEELAALVRKAHRLSLKVILDITPNHTSRDHVWIASHPEYYVRNEKGGLYHDFDWSDTAKLDYRRPELRQAMLSVLDYWLGFTGEADRGRPAGFDGFRLDMAGAINDLGFWNEALALLKERHADRELLFLAESYGIDNNLDLFSRGVNAAYDDDFYKVCVHFYGVDASGETVIAPSGEVKKKRAFRDQWRAFAEGGIAGAFERVLVGYADALPDGDGPWLARYTDNHDEGRGLYRFGAGAVKAVNRLLFLSCHAIPFLLTGQEFGALNRPSIHARIGPCDKGRRMVGDGGMMEEPGVEFEGNIFSSGRAERGEWYAFFRELIRLRRGHAALRRGSFTLTDAGEDCPLSERTVVAFERRWRGATVVCAVNLGPGEKKLNHSRFGGTVLYGGLEHGRLAAFSAVVARRMSTDHQ